MSAPAVVCIKGRIGEYGPQLEHAPHIIYAGRRANQWAASGGWNLPASPYANPYTIKASGSAERAVELYAAHLVLHPQTVSRAWRELCFRGSAACFGCWCDVEGGAPCHGIVLAGAVHAYGQRVVTPGGECGDGYAASAPAVLRGIEKVKPVGAWAGAL